MFFLSYIPVVSVVSASPDDIMTQSMSAILPGSPLSAPSSKARRRTDLMPTTPQSQLLPRGACTMETSFHGSTASSSSPGCHGKQQQQQQQRTPPNRAVSLSRLDQLAQPRRRLLQQKQMTPGADGRTDNNNSASRVSPGKSSMSRSMCHLGPKKLLVARGSSSGASPGAAAAALTAAATAVAGTLQSSPAAARSSLARSMTHLAASAPPAVRMTRAEKLRLKAKQPEGGSTSTNTREPPARSGATTPSTPSRPLSALSNASQVSNAGSSNVGGVRRRHPPGTVSRLKPRPVSIAGTSVELENRRHGGSASSTTPKRGADVGAPQKAASADKRMSRRSSGPTTPRKEASSASVVAENMVKAGDTGTIKRAPNKSKPASKEPSKEKPASPTPETASAPSTGSPESSLEPSTPVAEKKPFQDEASKTQKEDGDSLGNKPKITTEEEAKAAIAERRRLAREQAEREAEEQKRKEEEARLAEEERLRREEEEQRRFEAEQERLMEEARKAEEDRLKRAIEEAERQAEEEKKRKEEEARLKAEKEELEKRAREEAERLRQEREEKLRQEMEEREARRKKVEAIMLRTRGARGTKEGDQSGPSSVASGSSSSVASSTQASLDSVVAANATPSTNSISSVSSVTGATTPTGGATTTTATTTPNATPVPYPASSVPLDSPTSAFAPGQILMMTDSMTASMYEEAERNLKEEEAAEAANKKVWNRDVTTVNGNGVLFNDGDGKRPMVHSGETNGHANGHVDDGFLVDFSSLQTGVQDPLISSLDAVNKQTNPFAAALDHSSSNMASNAIGGRQVGDARFFGNLFVMRIRVRVGSG
ncbi:unnamed protein product [Notodromas monacha]|uniref:Ensconsin n=1 Tax=Notodromas monacha TaxID=399045 RepID=A0A7R9GGE1_9CRUS|nr:unnamed protein product [Notodromas monacha]CAG0921618.1 unnamed protein product [Notodromas monacha]